MIDEINITCFRLLGGAADKKNAESECPRTIMLYVHSSVINRHTLSTTVLQSLAEHLSDPPSAPVEGTLNDDNLEHHTPIMNGDYLHSIPYDEQTRVN